MNAQLLNASRRAMVRAARPAARRFASSGPSGQEYAPTDYGRLFRRTGGTALVFFPLAGVILGWPVVAKKVVEITN